MRSIKDIIWLSGILEGEGCFRITGGGAQIALAMTDKDVVEKAASVLGGNLGKPFQPKQKNRKIRYVVRVHGRLAISWMMTIFDLMGERRKQKIMEVLKYWKSSKRNISGHGQRTIANCHPDKPVHARLLCVNCYARWFRKNKKEHGTI